MANEYKQGIDRVAVDESFPYPIKLTYDDENVYLTVLRIPTLEEIAKMNSFANKVNTLDTNRLALIVETHSSRHIRGNAFVNMAKTGHRYKGGIFRHCCLTFYRNVTVGNTYSFPKIACFNIAALRAIENGNTEPLPWSYVRGTFWYGNTGRNAEDFNWKNASRTGIYSNIAKIEYTQ